MSANLLVLLGTVVIPLVVISFVSVVTFVNLYLNLRRRFPARVNCWFCNHDTHVPYDQSNSFVCPGCKQYNGFTADGDYNREIPEQYQQRLNNYHYHHPANVTDDDKWDSTTVRSGTTGSVHTGNGLCFGCNRNQELKIHQLASFVPEDEDNYEAEVEEYRKQLEMAYKLCGRCERILKRTLNDVKRNILGSKLSQIGSKSLNVLDMHLRTSTKHLAQQKRQRWAKVCVWAVTGLLLVKLHQDFTDSGWTVADLMLVCPAPLQAAITGGLSYTLATYELVCGQLERLLAEPTVQQTTERIETLGYEIFLQYVPRTVVQTSTHYFESLSNQVPTERSSPLLLNVAVVALAALLASLGSQRTIVKQLLIVVLCVGDCALEYAQLQDSSKIGLLLTASALTLSLTCIGQRLIRSDVPTKNLNSSFHKIYSQQCRESDYSDVDSTAPLLDESSSAYNKEQATFTRKSHANLYRRPAPGMDSNLSGKSLDTTESGSPSAFSLSPTNPFFVADDEEGSPTLGAGNKISGSLFNIASGNLRAEQIADKESVFSHGSIKSSATTGRSLLKTPSFSVDNFQTNGLFSQRAANHRLSGPPTFVAGSHRGEFKPMSFRYSMSTISQEAEEREDQLIEDDIDRLSISGRVSLNASRLLGASRTSLASGNPFAKKTLPDAEYTTASVRNRARSFRAPESFRSCPKDSPWMGGQLTHVSRTSSQSSGFESQTGTTRRNTPTEVDGGFYPTVEPAQLLETSHHISPQTLPPLLPPPSAPRSERSSPVPSSASAFEWSGGLSRHQPKYPPHRSLFNEQNLFNSALQQQPVLLPSMAAAPAPPSVGGPSDRMGLFFPKLGRTSTMSNAPFSVGAGPTVMITTQNNTTRHVFPPQQSKTPSYRQFSHNAIPGGQSVAGNGFYTSNKSTASGRASLLNLSKLTNELSNGTMPTA
uniref:Ima1 N-terminal domain-containing protein n=1 Tax=Anopheles dirus TaxID=7168 RepID=A0A182NCG8_9DIPT